MKYIVFENYGLDEEVKEFETKEEAITYADDQWRYIHDEKRLKAFYIIESAYPDEDHEWHYDGDYVKVYKEDK